MQSVSLLSQSFSFSQWHGWNYKNSKLGSLSAFWIREKTKIRKIVSFHDCDIFWEINSFRWDLVKTKIQFKIVMGLY